MLTRYIVYVDFGSGVTAQVLIEWGPEQLQAVADLMTTLRELPGATITETKQVAVRAQPNKQRTKGKGATVGVA